MRRQVAIGAALTLLAAAGKSSAASAGAVGLWHFDEGGGTTATDASGNGGNGLLEGGIQWVAGRFGTALEYDGVTGRVHVVDSPSLEPPTSVSVSAWFKRAGTPGDYRYILAKGASDCIAAYTAFTPARTEALSSTCRPPTGHRMFPLRTPAAEWGRAVAHGRRHIRRNGRQALRRRRGDRLRDAPPRPARVSPSRLERPVHRQLLQLRPATQVRRHHRRGRDLGARAVAKGDQGVVRSGRPAVWVGGHGFLRWRRRESWQRIERLRRHANGRNGRRCSDPRLEDLAGVVRARREGQRSRRSPPRRHDDQLHRHEARAINVHSVLPPGGKGRARAVHDASPAAGPADRKSCFIYPRVASFTRVNRSGANRFRFTGIRGVKLRQAPTVSTLTPISNHRPGKIVSVFFTIVG